MENPFQYGITPRAVVGPRRNDLAIRMYGVWALSRETVVSGRILHPEMGIGQLHRPASWKLLGFSPIVWPTKMAAVWVRNCAAFAIPAENVLVPMATNR
jgi:hypothetical protein